MFCYTERDVLKKILFGDKFSNRGTVTYIISCIYPSSNVPFMAMGGVCMA